MALLGAVDFLNGEQVPAQATVCSFSLDDTTFSAHALGPIDRHAERLGNLLQQVRWVCGRRPLVVGDHASSAAETGAQFRLPVACGHV